VPATLTLDRLSAFHDAGYQVAADCWRCKRWVIFDLLKIIDDYGDSSIVDFHPRCSLCGEAAHKQIWTPLVPFEGYTLWDERYRSWHWVSPHWGRTASLWNGALWFNHGNIAM